jgi:uridylate kinase
MRNSMIFKIGGSVIYDNALNVNDTFLSKLRDWYFGSKKNYEKIVMVVGGGSLSRDLQEKISDHIGGEEYLHSIGMSVTHTNANLLKGYIGESDIYIPQKLGEAYEALMEEGQQTIVCGGLKVGWSTDMDAAVFAEIIGESRINKISNIDYIYNKDPHFEKDATPIKDMTWDDYFELFDVQEGSNHSPNRSIPIDVECARFCSQKGITFWLSGGSRINDMEKFEDIISEGTLIHP